jgi:hypothetical protein
MDNGLALVTIGGITLAFNVGLQFLGGGWKLSGRLTSIESGMIGVRDELKKLSDVLVTMAEMRGDHRVLDQRLLAVEKHVDELRRGKGWIQPTQRTTVDGEYP